MIPLTMVAGAIAGAAFAGRSTPRTKLKKVQCLGPRSGLMYDVDVVPNLGIILVHAADGTSAAFQQNAPPKLGFSFIRGAGAMEVVEAMKKDLEP